MFVGVLVGVVLVAGLALYLWPQTPAGRGWLLGSAQRAAGDAGYTLLYRESRGNLWHGVRLRGVTLTGPGAEVQVARLDSDYSLPALLTRKLPLSVAAQGVRGEVAFDRLEFPTTTNSGEPPVELVLRDLSVDDVALDIDGVPYTLPALSVSDVWVEEVREGFFVEGAVTSPEGRAEVAAEVSLEPF